MKELGGSKEENLDLQPLKGLVNTFEKLYPI